MSHSIMSVERVEKRKQRGWKVDGIIYAVCLRHGNVVAGRHIASSALCVFRRKPSWLGGDLHGRNKTETIYLVPAARYSGRMVKGSNGDDLMLLRELCVCTFI